ncbi:GDP-L-fucose synthase [Campylobacter sp. MIT 99-7217]|uniref:GDP-L-fucose synthase family protein n=1 Tax=Campylobacter sp. MIT 99-7217 TaxID=535091 RepID=UPI001158A064|nr:GDP-L-fucose synthase [Campylobacter sp. MIT 99-7217]TQR33658.1 GDP-L-fucose synthase [Campylobacter sp. MIT 99-7217]
MKKDSKIFIAGHKGLVGSALMKKLQNEGFVNLITRSHTQLDLTEQKAVHDFFDKERPQYVFLCAAKAGGIAANSTYRADFIYENLMIESNVIYHAYKFGVKKLLFMASTSVYPKDKSFIVEEDLLSGKLDFSNKPYALAKMAGLVMCESFNIQYNTNFLGVTPINLYGNNDKFDLEKAHVMPALLRKFHLAKLLSEKKDEEVLKDLRLNNIDEARKYLALFGVSEESVEIWGSGKQKREFLHSDDLAEACIFLMQNVDFKNLVQDKKEVENTHFNISSNENIRIKDLALLIKKIVGFKGELEFNTSRPDGIAGRLTSSAKINALGWKAKINLEQGIKMMYEWYLKQNNFRK